jgi:hypothetical protein
MVVPLLDRPFATFRQIYSPTGYAPLIQIKASHVARSHHGPPVHGAFSSSQRAIESIEALHLRAKETGTDQRIVLHVIDGVGLVHALLPRMLASLLPIETPVLSGYG